MGTSAIFGFYYKGKYFMCENPVQSWPCQIGSRLIRELLKADFDEWARLLDNIKEVSDPKPTPEDIKKLEKYTILPDYQDDYDWNSLLARTKGSFKRTLESGYIINIAHLPWYDEYIYILDLDNKEFRCRGSRLEVDDVVALEKEELERFASDWDCGYDSEDEEF